MMKTIKFIENVPEEMKDFVYENYTFHDNKKEHGVLEKLKQAFQTCFLYAAIWLAGNLSAAR